MPIAKIRDAEIYYEMHGDGPPLLLISGMGGVAAYWQPQIETFARDFKVITFDQRGTGKSTISKTRYTVELLAQDTIDLLDALGLDSVHVCGHSTGGMIAQVLGTTAPQRMRSIVLYGTRAHADAFTWRAMGLRRELLLRGEVELFIRSTALFLYPSWWIVANQTALAQREDAGIAAFADADVMASRIDAVLHHDQQANLPAVTVPALVTCAEDDFLTPRYYSEQLQALLPDARLVFVEKGGHACSMTNPRGFNEVVLPFLLAQAASDRRRGSHAKA